MKPINTLVVYGKKVLVEEKIGDENEEVLVYNLESSNRDSSNQHKVSLENKIIELVLEDGTVWMCDASTLHEIYPELDPALKPKATRSNTPEEFVLPGTIDAPITERGIIGKFVVKVLKLFAKKALDRGIVTVARKLEDKHLLNGILENSAVANELEKTKFLEFGAGLLKIDSHFNFEVFNEKTSNSPYFLFIHGTNSDTKGAFESLMNSRTWSTLHDIYKTNVIAFQHRTLTESPLQNTVKLAELLPNNSELHILSHSRGGIIGDILNKYCNNEETPTGFTENHIELLEKEGREDDIVAIEQLNKIFKEKKIKVTKFIRVASPAAGTKLASKRLDQVLNVFFNLIPGVFGDVLKELLSAAIESKDNTKVLPGIEAMRPDSPFIKILNDPTPTVAIQGAPLLVISGNGRVNFSCHGLLVILGKLFFSQRNDLVVNTDSMYLGALRNGKIQYFFDQSAEVNHVNYFENETTREAIELVLLTASGEPVPGFKMIAQYEIPGSDRGIEHGELYPDDTIPSGNKPIVILLPGIMGSNLNEKKKEIWLHYGRILTGGLTKLGYSNVNRISAESVVKTSYYKMYKWLSTKYDVVIYPFDWREPLPVSAAKFNLKVKELLTFKQPIKIIGHSMGGVLVRDFLINHPDTWRELNNSKDFRMVFLGSPLGGSHRIPAVLFGEDAIINKLSKLDLFHTKKGLLKMFSKFPGILSLLPLTTDSENDFADINTWQKMRTYHGTSDWPLPSKALLNEFRIYRDNILKKRVHIDYSKMVYIAGKDKMTPTGYYTEDFPTGKDKRKTKKKLQFLYTGEGDQSVTWELGIPKEMAKESVYYSRVTHGALANDPELFDAIEEILLTGTTKLLSNNKPLLRGEEQVFRAEPDIDFDLSESGLERTVLGLSNKENPVGSQIPLTITVSNGDLRYAAHPILAGHFMNDGVLHAEQAINNYLQGSLVSKHRLGLYPGEIGSNAFFNQMQGTDFAGAIIVGLGEPDQLTSHQLAKTVEQGVLNYLLSIRNSQPSKKTIGVSSLIIGSGYGGLSVEGSIKAVIEGVNAANEKIKMLFNEGYRTVQNLEFVELYANRALNCMYVLNKIVQNENATLNVIIGNKRIKNLLGIRKRTPLDTSEDWWNRINVKHKPENKETNEPASLIFGASTNDSREEENQLFSSTTLIDLFISEVSTNNQWNPCTAKTLFELLIPNALKEKLKRKGNISWILDTKTASYPWELLQDSTTNAKPLCINAGMIRQLSTKEYRVNIKRVAERGALVIADPILEGYISQLPGAKREGTLVKEVMENVGYPVNSLIGKSAASIIKSFFCQDYTIIHMAGHGIYNPKYPNKSGMVIGKESFLSVFEIEQMPVVPELVFVNCCHLGATNAEDEKFYLDRYKLAANIGTQLIKIGVRAVIAAGWAVNDEAALDFSSVFYDAMFSGDTFGNSVKKARHTLYEKYPENNTWGAYQCYGDPFFKLKGATSGKRVWSPNYIVPQEAEIHLDNLLNQLEMATDTENDYLSELQTIIDAVDRDVFMTPHISERIAKIYQELAMYKEAIEKYEELLNMEDAGFSFNCMERFCNTRSKYYIQNYFEKSNPTLKDKKEAHNAIERVIGDLKVLLIAGKTAERLNLLGSSYKRLALLSPSKNERLEAYRTAMETYEMAYESPNNKNKVYSLVNAIELACLLVFNSSESINKKEVKGVMRHIELVEEAQDKLKEELKKLPERSEYDNLNYWDMVAFLNIDLCLLLIIEDDLDPGENNEAKMEDRWKDIVLNFNKIWKKVGSEAKKKAEMEHLQFLNCSLNYALHEPLSENAKLTNSPTVKDLEKQINILRNTLSKVRKQLKDESVEKTSKSKRVTTTITKKKPATKPKKATKNKKK
ncbi:CHAT domain-containing protein [Cochleicola gelatinilyticus]|uniref:Uncharacterized protein n=1 Tax=Cochleicola gelatinilyticus TaxID=1763537 RepID=A0A167K7D9_9FLAO|nr:CHAT domain-containing protein [Cochleicola gelatinilyticus]OAB81463.1 hypothetical protein ULVI_01185 [Cochleicola gelatinilyticus]